VRGVRPTTMLAGLALVLTACGAAATPEAADDAVDMDADEPDEPAVTEQEVADTEGPGLREGFYWQTDEVPPSLIDLGEILSGGPPPDGIPPIDDPVYETVEDAAGWLTDTSPVMVLRGETETKVFPLAIMTWHEIVNDSIDGEPAVITYCPLCNSGLAFSRVLGDHVLDFGTSGRLWRSNLVMYDRQYGNLWSQFTGEAIVGETFLGEELERIPSTLQGFGEVAATDPAAAVLSRDTGFSRDYGRNPYVGYDAVESDPFLFRGERDGRFPPMTRVVGFPDGDGTAVLLDHLQEQGVVEVAAAGTPVTLWWVPGQASALDRAHIDSSDDVGQTAAFVREVDGRELTFEAVEGEEGGVRFRDVETGSGWALSGEAIEGELEGTRLAAVSIDDTFWFVWAVFKPDTAIVGS
jgi:hypothetical protein